MLSAAVLRNGGEGGGDRGSPDSVRMKCLNRNFFYF